MQRKPKVKRFFNLISGLFLSIACFAGSYLAFRNGSADLSSLASTTGRIIERGVTSTEMNLSGRGIINRSVFYFKIQGIPQQFALYRIDQKYDVFFSSINVDDTVTVYYKPSPLDKPNLETFQVEKGGTVVVSKEQYQSKEKFAGWLTILGGLLLLSLTLNNDRRYWH